MTAFVDWTAQMHNAGAYGNTPPHERAQRTLVQTLRSIGRALSAERPQFRVSFRLYHGWHKGWQPTDGFKTVLQAVGATDFTALSRARVDFSSTVQYGHTLIEASFVSACFTIYARLLLMRGRRRSSRSRSRPGSPPHRTSAAVTAGTSGTARARSGASPPPSAAATPPSPVARRPRTSGGPPPGAPHGAPKHSRRTAASCVRSVFCGIPDGGAPEAGGENGLGKIPCGSPGSRFAAPVDGAGDRRPNRRHRVGVRGRVRTCRALAPPTATRCAGRRRSW